MHKNLRDFKNKKWLLIKKDKNTPINEKIVSKFIVRLTLILKNIFNISNTWTIKNFKYYKG